jgi:MinD-like ATPase involved in chromosome partitioning or flagellar assembly
MNRRSRGALIDGLPAHQGAFARVRRRAQRLAVSRAEGQEVETERRLLALPGVTRANVVAVMSPTGGVGKTACTFVVGNLLAQQLRLRVIAVDGNPAFGTLASLVPARRLPERGLAELLHDADRLFTAAEVGAYASRLPSGLHVLATRRVSDRVVDLEPDWYGELVALLSCFYEVVMLDLGPGVVGPLARFAAGRADQVVLVTTPDWAASSAGLEALHHIRQRERTTMVINGARSDTTLEDRFLAEEPHSAVSIPYDTQLAAMLDTRTYSLGALPPSTRAAIKRLTLAVAELLD